MVTMCLPPKYMTLSPGGHPEHKINVASFFIHSDGHAFLDESCPILQAQPDLHVLPRGKTKWLLLWQSKSVDIPHLISACR